MSVIEDSKIEEFKKNSNEFSFTKEVIDEVNNLDFKAGSSSLISCLSSKTEPIATKDNYIWYALSATAEDVGETIYQNVLNYMQNVADIDTCTTKALQSMVQILGSNYNVLDSLSSIPQELLDLVDIFSMRRDCLFDSAIMSKHTITASLSAALPSCTLASADEELSDNAALSSGTIYGQIDAQKLDDIISTALYNAMLSNICLTYNLAEDDYPIYKYLSDCILHDNFILPNRYKDKIDEYKTKWNIPKEFDPEEEAAKIDAGLSTFEQYDARQQDLLSIEMQREAEEKSKLEPRTRYAYFNEKKVKEYFTFVERWYSQIHQSYIKAKQYDIDHSYVEVDINDKNTVVNLLDKYGELNENMIEVVAKQLLDVITQARDLREYLKSQAQRTYMKGTFLLVSYAVNEYLKKNVYPAINNIHSQYAALSDMPVEWQDDDNQLELVEYVDQTQYYNIKSDAVEEDQMHIGEDPTDRVKSLNSKFWKDGSTAAGNATFIDTTNIVRKEDKAKLVQSRTFNMEQIADFYENVLGAMKDKQLSTDSQKRTYDFLSTVFETGADDSWWSDQHSKVMAILSNGRSTKEIEDYMSVLNDCYVSSQYVLSSFTPTPGTTLCMQLQTAATNYLASLRDKFNLDITNALSVFDVQIQNADNIMNSLDDLKEDFDNYKSRLETFINGNMTYTKDFTKQTSSIYAQQLATDYFSYAELKLPNNQIRTSILGQDDAFQSEHSQLTSMLTNTISQYAMVVDLSCNANRLNFNYNSTNDEVKFNIEFNYDPADPNEEDYEVVSACYEVLLSKLEGVQHYFEPMYSTVYDYVQQLQMHYASRKSQVENELLQYMNRFLASLSLDGIKELSAQLDKENYKYLEYQFLVNECVQDISSLLAYDNDPWYQYKKKLFLKYTGQDVGDTPYYYTQNSVHPSYQIHPCLSNFIEKVDYTYPIKNLAGIADGVLKQEMQKIVDGTLRDLIVDGYLKNIWKNPLNSNQDYLTRYEKTDHKDADLDQNIFFGWDGFIHPKTIKDGASCCFQDNKLLMPFASISKIVSKGQNYSSYDIEQLSAELSISQTMLQNALCSQSSADIVQYGLDIYGNSYILLKQNISNNPNDAQKNVLWFRRKNAPIPTLAFVCDVDGNYVSSSMFQNHTYANTQMFKSDDNIARISAYTINNTIYYTPTFDDFMFSPDKTTLYLRSKNTIVYADILQQYVDDETYVGYKRYALQDVQNREECLSVENGKEFKAWYFQGQSVGGIYANESLNGNNLSIDLEIVKREKQNYGKRSPHISASTILSDIVNTQQAYAYPAYACDADGNVGISYVKNVQPLADLTAKTTLSAEFDKQLSSYIDVLDGTAIAVKSFNSIGNALFEEYVEDVYTQFSDIGFMPALSGDNYIFKEDVDSKYYSQYNDELAYTKMLKVQIAAPSVDKKLGIDFRRVCPIRVREPNLHTDEGNSKYGNDSSTFHLSVDNGQIVQASLSGVLTTYVDVHFLESIYNQYVQQENDEQWYELVDEERLARKHPDASQNAANFDFLQLAHYDVMKYLSVLRDEQKELSIDYKVSELSVGEFLGIVQPYMMDENAIPSTYISGFLVSSDSANNNGNLFSEEITKEKQQLTAVKSCVLKFGRSDISVNWIDNGENKIKLDFNAPLYISSQIQEKFSSEALVFNERNKCNLFLNLDVPGEAGILNTYYKNNDNQTLVEDIWYIKNISEGHVPKFIIKNIINSAEPAATLPIVNVLDDRLKAGTDIEDSIQTTLLATEDPILTYIAFE